MEKGVKKLQREILLMLANLGVKVTHDFYVIQLRQIEGTREARKNTHLTHTHDDGIKDKRNKT